MLVQCPPINQESIYNFESAYVTVSPSNRKCKHMCVMCYSVNKISSCMFHYLALALYLHSQAWNYKETSWSVRAKSHCFEYNNLPLKYALWTGAVGAHLVGRCVL